MISFLKIEECCIPDNSAIQILTHPQSLPPTSALQTYPSTTTLLRVTFNKSENVMPHPLTEVRVKVDQLILAWRGAKATTDMIGEGSYRDALDTLIEEVDDSVRAAEADMGRETSDAVAAP